MRYHLREINRLWLEENRMSNDSQGFSSGVTYEGSYQAPKVSKVVLDEGGNYVSPAAPGTLGTSIIQ